MQVIKNFLHGVFPLIGALLYGIPGKRLSIIGITGTDGKSSSVILTAEILRTAGYKTAHFSSISFHNGDTEFINESKMTTPGRMQLHKFLKTAIKNGCTHAVVEITSQGILQHRHRFIGFSLVGITNITPEHIEAHNGFEQYQATKISLARALVRKKNYGVVIDKDTHKRVVHLLPKQILIHTVKLGDGSLSQFSATVIEETPFTSTLDFKHNNEKITLHTKLGGPFISHNILFAGTIASLYGVSLTVIRDAIEKIDHIPGRFEIISQKPLILVDYAHTINALEILLPYVRSHTKEKLIHVFGAAGGGRDRYKRTLIARLSEKYTNVSILTEENSFDEPIDAILKEIRGGFTEKHSVYTIPHREEAVLFAHGLLHSPHDTLLLTAKGSETVIAGPHGTKRPYTERNYIRCLLKTSSSAY